MRAGLDEAALYIFSPIPGAELSKSMSGYKSFHNVLSHQLGAKITNKSILSAQDV